MARNRSRPIEVGGTAYRWTFRRRAAHYRGGGCTLLTFVAERDTGQGALLVVNLPAVAPARPVLPSTVAESVTRALVAGWRPGTRGPVPRLRPGLHHRRTEPRGARAVGPLRHAGLRRRD
ncbi:hypothetical protein [Actinoplanes sp. NPDC049599]|uniref:hypothetical protein n=1 Tax=Actinoplanes sp. NPDC049599 TaxID=3363903 RepID=UPI0037B94B7C